MPPLLTEEETAIDPYTTLGLTSNATEQEVKKAFRRLSLKYHPDKDSSEKAQVKFRAISVAVEILSDSSKRAFIDRKVEVDRARKEKYELSDKKRKDLIDALRDREEAAKKAKVDEVKRRQQASAEEAVVEHTKKMLAEAQKRATAATSASRHSTQPKAQPTTPTSNGHSHADARPHISEEDLALLLTIPSSSSFTSSSQLKTTLESRYGRITRVDLRDPPEGEKKKKRKRRAVVDFAEGNWGGCWACMKDHAEGSVSGGREVEDGIKAMWLAGKEPAWVKWAEMQAENINVGNGNAHEPQSQPQNGKTTMADLLARHRKDQGGVQVEQRKEDVESTVLFKLRQMKRAKADAASVSSVPNEVESGGPRSDSQRELERRRLEEQIRREEEAEEMQGVTA
ncbi:hypothetical protein BCR39DRAFT_548078 [Naematelia encephala]|uniref:J domain-containing protein n=1 Tax=Naematelia encephala TaxID=71784 RepID=A0A1Y2AN47_9TREE|nr:hypothetical protein BCR39DRAFT_548078 [Naematelia encephala]